jgi:chromosome segregation ATPase
LAENYQREITEQRNKVLKLEQELREAQSLTLDSTKPLLREVQQLQTRLQQLQTQHVTAEEQWRARVVSEEQRAVTAVNEARDWQNKALDLRKQLAALESDLDSERQQHRATTLTNKEMRATEQQLRDQISALNAQLTGLQRTVESLTSDWTKKETELNHVIAAQKMKLDDLATQLAEQRQLLTMQSATINSAPLPSPSLTRVPSRAELPVLGSDTWPHALTMEKLKLASQQRDGEVQRLQAELTNQRAENARLSDHVLALSTELDVLKRENGSLKQGEARVKDLETRYLAALEMLGEKSERVEEISGDLSEFKRLYKQQINTLCGQIEELTRRNRELENRLKA